MPLPKTGPGKNGPVASKVGASASKRVRLNLEKPAFISDYCCAKGSSRTSACLMVSIGRKVEVERKGYSEVA